MNRILSIIFLITLLSCSDKLHKSTVQIHAKNQGVILEKSIIRNNNWNKSGIEGTLVDLKTNDTLSFWGIEFTNKLESGRLTTNEEGYFSIDTLMGGYYTFRFMYIGYQVITIDSLLLKKREIINVKIGLSAK